MLFVVAIIIQLLIIGSIFINPYKIAKLEPLLLKIRHHSKIYSIGLSLLLWIIVGCIALAN